MKKNVILIGCGRIGFLLENDPLRKKPCTHAGGALSAGIAITHAVDIDRSRLEKFRCSSGISPENCSTHYRELLNRVTPHCVIIATWTESHTDIALFAARRGAEIIVCEKPLSWSLKTAKNLIETCEKTGCRLLVNHERRYDPRYRKAAELLRSGKIGELKTIHGQVLTGPYGGSSSLREGGGPLLHDGTHMIDIIRYFAGDITEVTGSFQRDSRSSGYEDRAAAWLKTHGGIDIFLEAGGSRNYFQFEAVISGTEGKIVIGNGYQSLFLSRPSRYYRGFRDLREVNFPAIKNQNCFTELYREVKKLMKNRKNEITSTGRDGYSALEIIHGIYLSAWKNETKITLPLKQGEVNLQRIFDISS